MKNHKNQKLPSIQEVLGEMGEHFVQRHLSSHSDSYTRADGINFLAEHLLREDLKEDFDYSADAIRALTGRCRSSSKCVRFDAIERPCLKDEFYEKNYDFARSCRHDRQLLHRFVWFDQRSFGLEQKCIQQMGQ